MAQQDEISLNPEALVPRESSVRLEPLSFAEQWHALAWRPAGSLSLSENWLKAGTAFPTKPAKTSRRRGR